MWWGVAPTHVPSRRVKQPKPTRRTSCGGRRSGTASRRRLQASSRRCRRAGRWWTLTPTPRFCPPVASRGGHLQCAHATLEGRKSAAERRDTPGWAHWCLRVAILTPEPARRARPGLPQRGRSPLGVARAWCGVRGVPPQRPPSGPWLRSGIWEGFRGRHRGRQAVLPWATWAAGGPSVRRRLAPQASHGSVRVGGRSLQRLWRASVPDPRCPPVSTARRQSTPLRSARVNRQ